MDVILPSTTESLLSWAAYLAVVGTLAVLVFIDLRRRRPAFAAPVSLLTVLIVPVGLVGWLLVRRQA